MGEKSIVFDVQSQLVHGVEKLRDLKEDLMATLGVADVELRREDGALRLRIVRADTPPVSLPDLLELMPELPAATAVLGLAEDGRPVLLDFTETRLPHMLIAGGPNAGKTVLLRTLATSLALSSRQSQLQLVIVDPVMAGGAPSTYLQPLAYLPHLVTPILHELEETADIFNFLVREMEYRQEQQSSAPRIVVLVDHAEQLLARGGAPIGDAIMGLAQRGVESGIHLVLSTRQPDAPALDTMLKANLPVRIVGRVADEAIARAAAGVDDTQAHYLLGRGDFVAVTGDTMTRFQAAHIDDYELHLILETLYRNQPPSLLAQPAVRRTMLPGEEKIAEQRVFMFEEEISWSEPANGYAGDETGEGQAEEWDIPFASDPDEGAS